MFLRKQTQIKPQIEVENTLLVSYRTQIRKFQGYMTLSCFA